MKKTGKLQLRKERISNLSKEQSGRVVGGATSTPPCATFLYPCGTTVTHYTHITDTTIRRDIDALVDPTLTTVTTVTGTI